MGVFYPIKIFACYTFAYGYLSERYVYSLRPIYSFINPNNFIP
jgi:hypothetical protein